MITKNGITRDTYQFSVLPFDYFPPASQPSNLSKLSSPTWELALPSTSVEIQRMFLFHDREKPLNDVRCKVRISLEIGLERSENGFLLDFQDPFPVDSIDRSIERSIVDGEENMAKIRKEGREERKRETATGNWGDVAFRWTTPRTGRRASTRRREEFEKERPVWNRHRVLAREKADSRGVFLRWRSHALPDFRAREDEIHPDRKREEKGGGGGNLGERCRIRRGGGFLRSSNNDVYAIRFYYSRRIERSTTLNPNFSRLEIRLDSSIRATKWFSIFWRERRKKKNRDFLRRIKYYFSSGRNTNAGSF